MTSLASDTLRVLRDAQSPFLFLFPDQLIPTPTRAKNNPGLIGEPDVGKTSITEGLAQRIDRDVPASLICRVFSLDMGALMAGAKYKGEYEERIKSVLNEVEKAASDGGPGVILFVDELRLIMAGRKPIQASARPRKASLLWRDDSGSVPEIISILHGIREKYEVHHGVRILDGALIAAATLASRYLTARRLPDSAIDLIDVACARCVFF